MTRHLLSNRSGYRAVLVLTVAWVAFCLWLGAARADEQPGEVFDKVWAAAKENIYDTNRAQAFFTEEAYGEWGARAAATGDLYALTPIVNEFLQSLGVSHTRFYDDTTIDYYMFRSLFSTGELDAPVVSHIGAQFVAGANEHVVREVLDGYPAHTAGLRRGDVIVAAGGEAFHPYHAFNPNADGNTVTLEVRRGAETMSVSLAPVAECPHQSFYNAMLNSRRIIERGDKRIGYVHLWTGTNERVLSAFTDIVEDEFAGCDAVILDLRGGFGGAWYDYIDPFFADRSDYFEYTWIKRDGERQVRQADAERNPSYFDGAMVVLINEGTRSGKEALAYQFRKSERATLVGTRTWGAFTAGRGIFSDTDAPYLLYLAIGELLLDGNKVEGVGIAPHIDVPYPTGEAPGDDPQLERALQELDRQLSR